MTNYELAQTLHKIADCILLADRISKQHSCNDCGIQKVCEVRPDWGEPTRINCPLWQKDGGQS